MRLLEGHPGISVDIDTQTHFRSSHKWHLIIYTYTYPHVYIYIHIHVHTHLLKFLDFLSTFLYCDQSVWQRQPKGKRTYFGSEGSVLHHLALGMSVGKTIVEGNVRRESETNVWRETEKLHLEHALVWCPVQVGVKNAHWIVLSCLLTHQHLMPEASFRFFGSYCGSVFFKMFLKENLVKGGPGTSAQRLSSVTTLYPVALITSQGTSETDGQS